MRTSARKARLVLEQIRGKSAGEAQAILAFTPVQPRRTRLC